MESDPSSIMHDDWPTESPESDVIDLREPTGFDLLESTYGHAPEALAKNASLALVLLLDQTESTMVIGKDSPFMGEASQSFLDKILLAMADTQHRSGYARLFNAYSRYLGGSPEFARSSLIDLMDRRDWYFKHFPEVARAQSSSARDRLRDGILTLRQSAIEYLSETNSDWDDLDQTLLWEFQNRTDALANS